MYLRVKGESPVSTDSALLKSYCLDNFPAETAVRWVCKYIGYFGRITGAFMYMFLRGENPGVYAGSESDTSSSVPCR